ncbi:hypothetical protein Pelo_12259 [Pelomyxa schiedti]|nr:hypothetical protein Pelo_12259 [Pelomyxa schiedti]
MSNEKAGGPETAKDEDLPDISGVDCSDSDATDDDDGYVVADDSSENSEEPLTQAPVRHTTPQLARSTQLARILKNAQIAKSKAPKDEDGDGVVVVGSGGGGGDGSAAASAAKTSSMPADPSLQTSAESAKASSVTDDGDGVGSGGDGDGSGGGDAGGSSGSETASSENGDGEENTDGANSDGDDGGSGTESGKSTGDGHEFDSDQEFVPPSSNVGKQTVPIAVELHHPRVLKKVRSNYTAEEDVAILQFVHDNPSYGVQGNAIWRLLAGRVPNHTWQSLRTHYRYISKKSIPQLQNAVQKAKGKTKPTLVLDKSPVAQQSPAVTKSDTGSLTTTSTTTTVGKKISNAVPDITDDLDMFDFGNDAPPAKNSSLPRPSGGHRTAPVTFQSTDQPAPTSPQPIQWVQRKRSLGLKLSTPQSLNQSSLDQSANLQQTNPIDVAQIVQATTGQSELSDSMRKSQENAMELPPTHTKSKVQPSTVEGGKQATKSTAVCSNQKKQPAAAIPQSESSGTILVGQDIPMQQVHHIQRTEVPKAPQSLPQAQHTHKQVHRPQESLPQIQQPLHQSPELTDVSKTSEFDIIKPEPSDDPTDTCALHEAAHRNAGHIQQAIKRSRTSIDEGAIEQVVVAAQTSADRAASGLVITGSIEAAIKLLSGQDPEVKLWTQAENKALIHQDYTLCKTIMSECGFQAFCSRLEFLGLKADDYPFLQS